MYRYPAASYTLLLAMMLPGVVSAVLLPANNIMQSAMVTSPNPQSCDYHTVTAAGCDPHFERLQVVSIRKPLPLPPGMALVRVMASSVNPCDWKRFLVQPQTPYVPGTDYAGVIEEPGDCHLNVGDRVWGVGGGTYTEFMAIDCAHIGLMPADFSFAEAGSSGVVALTGLEGLRWAGAPWEPSAAPRVLVLGGSGGTGHVGIQLAKAMGAKSVITTCSPDNFDFVRSMGADRALDYHTENWWEVLEPGSVDIIYDCISLPGTGDHAFSILADGGKFITLLTESRVSPAVAQKHPTLKEHYFFMSQSGTESLNMLKTMAEAGQLRIVVEETYDGLDRVVAAMNHTMKGHSVGKNAIVISTA